jgi:amino acid permease
LLIESNIKGQCTTECKCKNDEKRNRLHLNVIIITETSFYLFLTYLCCIKQKNEGDSFRSSHKLLYFRLSYFAHVCVSHFLHWSASSLFILV